MHGYIYYFHQITNHNLTNDNCNLQCIIVTFKRILLPITLKSKSNHKIILKFTNKVTSIKR